MEFKKTRLGDFIDTISDTTPIKKDKVILINTSDVENGYVLNHSYVENKNLKGQFKKRFKNGDILYSEIRPRNRRFAYINFDADDYIASTKLMVLRNKGNIYNDFLFQILKSETIINQLQLLAETRSGTFPQITFKELSNLEVFIPTLESQKKISSFLTNIDKKIELNNHINDNLFELGIALYNSLYKDNNYSKVKFGEIVSLLRDGTHNPPKRIEKGIPLLTGQTINNGFINYEKMTYVSQEDFNKIHSKYEPIENDLVLTKIGTVGKVGILRKQDIPMCIHCNSALIRFNDKYIDQYSAFWLLNSDYFKEEFNKIVTNTVQDFVSLGAMADLNIKIPNSDVVNKNKILLKNILLKMSELNNENKKLEKLRDTLLPKLMNGEIDLDKIEI